MGHGVRQNLSLGARCARPRYSSANARASTRSRATDAAPALSDDREPGRKSRPARPTRARRDGVDAARVVPAAASRPQRVRRRAVVDRQRSDDLPTLHRRPDDGVPRSAPPRPRPRDRNRLGLPDGDRLARQVCTVERLPDLLVEAEERFRRLGLTNIRTRLGDGAVGWPEDAPFDGILVTAAAPRVPEPLLAQLAPNGRLVIPIGDLASQELVILQRSGSGFEERSAGAVRFVPLISRLAFVEESRS